MKKARLAIIAEVLLLLLMFAFSYYVFYEMTSREGSDISIHAVWAAEGNFSDWRSFVHHGAHPMWHVCVAILLRLGCSLYTASALVTALCKALETALIIWAMDKAAPGRLSRMTRMLLAAVCAMVSCLCVPFYNPTVYYGVGTPNTWHSCTQMIALVWMIPCVCITARSYDQYEARLLRGDEHPVVSWRLQIMLGLLLIGSLLAKPTFMQAFLPATCLFFLFRWIKQPRGTRYFLQTLLCVLPAVCLMIVQYLYYFGIIVPSQGSMVLEITWQKLGYTVIRTLLILAFPIYVLCCDRRKKDTLASLTIWMNAVAIIEFAILGEDGRRAADGNFGWGLMGAALMAWLVALARFFADLCEERRSAGKLPLKAWPGFVLILWHLASGIYYLVYLIGSGKLL